MSVIDFLKLNRRIELNSQQIQAVHKVEGPILLLAVPGSGKTTVLIARIQHMIQTCLINPESILNLTFSVESAKDMGKRYDELFDSKGLVNLDFRTVHSLCYKVIKDYEHMKGSKAFVVMDQGTGVLRNILFEILKEYPSEDLVFSVQQMIGFCKNMLMKTEEVEAVEVSGCEFHMVYKAYEQYKLSRKLMDYDDLLVYALRILRSYPELLQKYHEQYGFVNVDEAQDVSFVQHEIIRLLAQKSQNLFMVGDEDQSIYGFRAAYPKALIDFKSHFPQATILKMEQNFRSTAVIVKASNDLIQTNKERYEKKMYTARENGEEVLHTHFEDTYSQYAYLAKVLKKPVGNKQIAVLFRNNDSVIPLYDILERAQVQVAFKQGQVGFFTHVIVKDILCFMRLALDPGDGEAFEKIYYKIKCGLTKDIVVALLAVKRDNVFKTLHAMPVVKESMRKKLGVVKDKLSKIKHMSALKAIESIEKDLGYGDYMKKLSSEGQSATSVNQKINALKCIAKSCEGIQDFMSRLTVLEQGCQGQNRGKSCNILLSTIHSSKGLEFDQVILVDLIEGILPSRESVAQLKLGKRELFEEEVRLFYVAMTRAKSHIEVITANKMNGQGITISQFVDFAVKERVDLKGKKKTQHGIFSVLNKPTPKVKRSQDISDASLEYFKMGVRIRHKSFGVGIIEESNRGMIVVQFDSGIKPLDLRIGLESGVIKILDHNRDE